MRRSVASAGIGAFVAIAAFAGAAAPGHAESLAIGGTGAAQGTIKLLADGYAKQRPDVAFELPRSLGSSGGIKAVVAGALDIATSGRPLRDAERQADLVEHAFASTAFVIVTSHKTFRENVTNADVVAIFSLERTTWPDGSMIRPVLRPESDADTDYLAQHFPGLALGLDAARKRLTVPIAKTDQDNLDAAESLPGSFAATSLAGVVSEGRKLAVLSLDGVEPTLANVESGAYKYVKTLYLVTRERKSQSAQDFLVFVASPEGGRILGTAGALRLPMRP